MKTQHPIWLKNGAVWRFYRAFGPVVLAMWVDSTGLVVNIDVGTFAGEFYCSLWLLSDEWRELKGSRFGRGWDWIPRRVLDGIKREAS
jgi:hypothetical protein